MARRLAFLTAILLIGAALRVRGLHTMLGMAHYDESYYGIDALSLVAQPRFTPFFPGNFGRESLWMYLLAPSLAVFGGGSFGLRIVAIFTGVLTLAAVYRLACELIGRRGAIWSAAALAVLFWHVLASHEAFRALLFPLVGALAFAYLWAAHRTNRPRLWIAAGVFLGLLAYTYLAARVWIALAGVMLIGGFVRSRSQRRGAILTALIAGVIGLPLLIYILTNPVVADQRIDQVAITGIGQLVSNLGAWLRVWFNQGATDVVYNLPGRPLLDLPLAALFVAGIAALIVRRNRSSWLILLAGASIVPALLTVDPLKWLRAIGLNVPLAILLGLGALAIERGVAWMTRRDGFQTRLLVGAQRAAPLLPVIFLIGAGANTVRDFDRWVNSPDLFVPMEQHIYAGIDWIVDHAPDDPVYFSPFSPDHPVLRLREWRLGDRPVGAFDATNCLALTSGGSADYFALTMYDPGFKDRLAQWATVQPLYIDPVGKRYGIYSAQTNASLFALDAQRFGGVLTARIVQSIPSAADRGASVAVSVGLQRTGATDRPYTLFVHLYQGAELGQNIHLLSQVDQPICLSYPPSDWRSDELIVQTFNLPIPADLAPGMDTIAFGVYDSLTQQRLPVGDSDYVALQTIDVR